MDIKNSGLASCENLTNVYYTGTKNQWDQIALYDYNTPYLLPSIIIHTNYTPAYECIENIIAAVDTTTNETLIFSAKLKANYLGKDYGIIFNNKKFYGAKPGDTVGNYNGSTEFTFDSWTGEFSIVLKEVSVGTKNYRYFIDDKMTNESKITVFAK